MLTVWTQNLQDKKAVESFTNTVLSARPVLERLSQILQDQEADIDRSELTLDAYSAPDWANKQAHKNGQRHMLRTVKNIIALDQQKESF